MSFGIGAFPFGLFASTFNFGDPVIRGKHKVDYINWIFKIQFFSFKVQTKDCYMFIIGHGAHGTNPANLEDERFLSQLFLWVAILFIFWLLVA